MERVCGHCQAKYDDAECSTICPHQLIMPREDLERKKLALSLIELPIQFVGAPQVAPFAPPLFVESVSFNGMVTLRGLSRYREFAPHLFSVVRRNRG